jgi:class 3 adenylate cyclase
MISLDWQTSEPNPMPVDEPQQRHRRSLRAALVANIVGIDDQASASQNGAAVEAHNRVLLTVVSQLGAHNGWLFRLQGKQIFAIFDSAVGSVRCALEIQKQLHLSDFSEGIRLRIGIHMGEVQFEDELPQGEVLSIAAKLERVADSGGILISSLVMDLVANQISSLFEEHQVPELRNALNRSTAFAAPPLERPTLEPRPMPISTGPRTTEHNGRTIHLVGDHSMGSSTKNIDARRPLEATVPVACKIADQVDAVIDALPPSAETKKSSANNQSVRQIQADPLPGESDAVEALEHQTDKKTPQPTQPSAVLTSTTGSSRLDDPRLSNECIESLIGALTVQLGPISKVIVDQSLKDASSNEHLISLIEEKIPSEQGRALFRVRASHICTTYSGDPG